MFFYSKTPISQEGFERITGPEKYEPEKITTREKSETTCRRLTNAEADEMLEKYSIDEATVEKAKAYIIKEEASRLAVIKAGIEEDWKGKTVTIQYD